MLRPQLLSAIVIALWAYPAVLVNAHYVTWAIAWNALGHQPQPSIDDPKSISLAVNIAYDATMLLLIGFPIAAIAGVAGTFAYARHRHVGRWATMGLVASLVGLWAATIAFLRADPSRVIEWFMD